MAKVYCTATLLLIVTVFTTLGCESQPSEFPHSIAALDGVEFHSIDENGQGWSCVLEGTRTENAKKLSDELLDKGWAHRSTEIVDKYTLKSDGKQYGIVIGSGKLAEDNTTIIRDPKFTLVTLWVRDIE